MELNEANVAQHKFFREAKFDRQKIDENSRLGELSIEKIKEIVDNAVPVAARKNTKLGMRLLSGTYQPSFP